MCEVTGTLAFNAEGQGAFGHVIHKRLLCCRLAHKALSAPGEWRPALHLTAEAHATTPVEARAMAGMKEEGTHMQVPGNARMHVVD